jgi:hypothetical protein
VPVDRAITYHDPCRLNKRKGIWEEPRELLRAIPGLRFEDVDRVTQWSYCSGGGGGLPIEKPELTAKISAMRLERAGGARRGHPGQRLSRGPSARSARPGRAGHRRRRPARAVRQSLGITVGGSRGDVGDRRLAQERTGVAGRARRTAAGGCGRRRRWGRRLRGWRRLRERRRLRMRGALR